MENRDFENILFCTDLSDNADFAFQYAVDAAERCAGSTLHILHVVPESEAQFWKTYVYEVDGVDDKAKHDIDARMQQAYFSRIPSSVSVTAQFRVGRDWQEILSYAEEIDSDLIVMGRQGRGALQKALFGNVTEKVVRKAESAVLVVPLSFQRRVEAGNEY